MVQAVVGVSGARQVVTTLKWRPGPDSLARNIKLFKYAAKLHPHLPSSLLADALWSESAGGHSGALSEALWPKIRLRDLIKQHFGVLELYKWFATKNTF